MTAERPTVPLPPHRVVVGLALLVPVVAVAVLGFHLGRGDGPTAVATAVAVLIAGSPTALLSVLPHRVPDIGPRRFVVAAVPAVDDTDDLRRFATALHRAAGDHLVDSPEPLPGVSDLDGTPGTGLRGITSELDGDRVVAHAVLVGPPAWLAEHGVAADPATGPRALCVAWDGLFRGVLEIEPVQRPHRPVVIRSGVAAASAAGVAVAAVGVLSLPQAAVLALVSTGVLAASTFRLHPVEATAR